jgi:hypothetical protein
MKIVINRKHGGFGLSDVAFELLLQKKNIEFDRVLSTRPFGQDAHEYYRKGHVGEEEHYISHYDFYDDTSRKDLDLVAVVEELGKKANGYCAELHIVEIPDDVDWFIDEYDGMEWVAEKSRKWC